MAIAYIQSASGVNDGGGNGLNSSAIATTAGNCLIVAVGCYNTTSVPVVSDIADTAANVYTSLGSYLDDGNNAGTELWISKNIIANASNVVTVTWSGSCSYRTILVSEYAGVHLTDPQDIDYTPVNSIDNVSPYTSQSDSTIEDNELVICSFYDYVTAVDSYSSFSPSTLRVSVGNEHAFADTIAPTIGSYYAAVSGVGVNRGHMCLARAIRQKQFVDRKYTCFKSKLFSSFIY